MSGERSSAEMGLVTRVAPLPAWQWVWYSSWPARQGMGSHPLLLGGRFLRGAHGIGRKRGARIGTGGLLVGPLECALGLALILNWRPRITMPAATLLMAAFTALTGYAWLSNANLDCGCFGALAERTPGEAAVEDSVMLLLLLVAWRWGTGRLPAVFPRAFRVAAIGALIPSWSRDCGSIQRWRGSRTRT